MHTKLLTSMIMVDPGLGNPLNLLDKAMERYGDIKTFFSKYKNPIGIELEIENVSTDFRRGAAKSLYWKYHEDNSLKMAGAEFVSVPLSGQNIDYAIHEFSKMAEGMPFTYGVRTSTHVHVNVSFMAWDELCSLILLSAYMEPLLYTLCDPERKGNPYCYPISTLDPEAIFSFNPDLKYCGINTAPISKQMTVEYRQLHGTNDWKLIRRWIQILCKIYFFAKNTSSKEVRGLLRDVIRNKSHENLLKRILGATLVLFPDKSPCDENLLWVLSCIDFAENL